MKRSNSTPLHGTTPEMDNFFHYKYRQFMWKYWTLSEWEIPSNSAIATIPTSPCRRMIHSTIPTSPCRRMIQPTPIVWRVRALMKNRIKHVSPWQYATWRMAKRKPNDLPEPVPVHTQACVYFEEPTDSLDGCHFSWGASDCHFLSDLEADRIKHVSPWR